MGTLRQRLQHEHVALGCALPFVVSVVRHEIGNEYSAPYIAGAIVQALSIFFGFFGHQHISFARTRSTDANKLQSPLLFGYQPGYTDDFRNPAILPQL